MPLSELHSLTVPQLGRAAFRRAELHFECRWLPSLPGWAGFESTAQQSLCHGPPRQPPAETSPPPAPGLDQAMHPSADHQPALPASRVPAPLQGEVSQCASGLVQNRGHRKPRRSRPWSPSSRPCPASQGAVREPRTEPAVPLPVSRLQGALRRNCGGRSRSAPASGSAGLGKRLGGLQARMRRTKRPMADASASRPEAAAASDRELFRKRFKKVRLCPGHSAGGCGA